MLRLLLCPIRHTRSRTTKSISSRAGHGKPGRGGGGNRTIVDSFHRLLPHGIRLGLYTKVCPARRDAVQTLQVKDCSSRWPCGRRASASVLSTPTAIHTAPGSWHRSAVDRRFSRPGPAGVLHDCAQHLHVSRETMTVAASHKTTPGRLCALQCQAC